MAFGTGGVIVPSSAQPIASGTGHVTPTWQRFFNALVASPAPITTVNVGASPYSYTAASSGTLVVTGGTVSSKTLTRGGTTVTISATDIPMANGDVAVITYSGLPTINFVPS